MKRVKLKITPFKGKGDLEAYLVVGAQN